MNKFCDMSRGPYPSYCIFMYQRYVLFKIKSSLLKILCALLGLRKCLDIKSLFRRIVIKLVSWDLAPVSLGQFPQILRVTST